MSEIYSPAEDSYLMSETLKKVVPRLLIKKPGLALLEVGCGSGIIISNLSKFCGQCFGVDVIDYRIIKEGYLFKKVDSEILPFDNDSFDIVISNQVIEHVSNQDLHIKEIHRVLKHGGVCYLATPNKYWPIEPHYYLPFLGVLSQKIANWYMGLFYCKNYDVKLLSYNQLTQKLEKYFEIDDFTKRVVERPNKYHLEKFYRIIPRFFIKMISVELFPSFILVLRKS